MSYRLDIRPEAVADIAEAAAWYEERQPGLGERLTREIIAAIEVWVLGGAFRSAFPIALFIGLLTRPSWSSQ